MQCIAQSLCTRALPILLSYSKPIKMNRSLKKTVDFRIKLTVILFFIISISNSAYAQYPQWFNYTNGDRIRALAEEGINLWIGTSGGAGNVG